MAGKKKNMLGERFKLGLVGQRQKLFKHYTKENFLKNMAGFVNINGRLEASASFASV